MTEGAKSPRIVIVGAGSSGLAAASRLLKNGFRDVTILEASDRIGGRVYSVNIGYQSPSTTEEERRHTVEIGAQWVHGEEGNVAFELATKEGLLDQQEHIQKSMIGDFRRTYICTSKFWPHWL